MKRASRFVEALAFLLFALIFSPVANSSIITVTYSSTLNANSEDRSGVFGQPGRNLAGSSIDAEFTFDLTLGNRTTAPLSDQLLGGAPLAPSMPLLSGSISVDGVKVPFPLNGQVQMLVQRPDPSYGTFFLRVQYTDPPVRSDIFYVEVDGPNIQSLLTSEFFESDVSGGGNFQFRTDVPDAHTVSSIGQFERGSLRLEVVNVPEPGSLILFLTPLLLLLVSHRRGKAARLV